MKQGRTKEVQRELRFCFFHERTFQVLKRHPGFQRPGAPCLHGSPFPVCDQKKGVCVCVRLCICVCTLGLAVQLGPRLFCLLRGKGMPKSNMVNKMPRKRHKEKKRIRSEEKDGEWQGNSKAADRRSEQEKGRGNSSEKKKKRLFFNLLPTAFLLLFAFQWSRKVE